MMRQIQFVVVLACLSLINCEPPSTSYGTPQGAPLNSYGTPNYEANGHDHQDYGEPKSYEFGYQVKDDYTGNNYNRKESSDGNQVHGEYRVQLPDGRTQIVTYYADWQTGFHADVRYEGTAQYPEQYNTGYNNNNGNGGYNNDLSGKYGAPNYNNNNNNYNNAYNNGYNNGGGSATSSVTIKDYSSSNNLNSGYNNNNYDSYNNAASFGNKARPSNEYGAP